MFVSAIITAGGVSRRFGKNKLLEKVNNDNRAIIEITISKFIDIVDLIVIPAIDETKKYLLNSKTMNNKIKFVSPGTTRQKSVYSALMAIEKSDIVLIHDGARPFIKKEEIREIIQKTIEKKAVVAGYRAVDTIKKIDKEVRIIKTIDRSTLFHAQTPQAFDFELIKKAHEKYKDRDDFTDDSALLEEMGKEVYYFETSRKNIKITTKDDFDIIL